MSGGEIFYWQARVPTIAQLVARAAREAGCSRAAICSPAKQRGSPKGAPNRARWAVMKAARECRFPLKRIGERLGGRDHSTVRHGLFRAEQLASEDPDFRRLLDAVRAELPAKEAR